MTSRAAILLIGFAALDVIYQYPTYVVAVAAFRHMKGSVEIYYGKGVCVCR
jgi:hypothetical protein